MRRVALAFVLAVPFALGEAQAMDSTNLQTYQRSELAATALAWIAPGLGHLYADEQRRGETILMLGALILVAEMWVVVDLLRYGLCFDPDCDDWPRWHAYAQGTMVGIGAGAWLFGLYDARLAVRRQRKLRNRPRSSAPQLSLVVSPRLGTADLAVGMRWTW
ncbi:MAG: hypothetical protein ACT4P6_04660 [Gemmatimonadaceae bacterium]